MGNFVTKAIARLLAFAYGLLTIFLYGYLATRGGRFFKKRTERQNLELQLGKNLLLAPGPCSHKEETFLMTMVDP
jgi:hypothetical protein